jgi:hypothetical protein
VYETTNWPLEEINIQRDMMDFNRTIMSELSKEKNVILLILILLI